MGCPAIIVDGLRTSDIPLGERMLFSLEKDAVSILVTIKVGIHLKEGVWVMHLEISLPVRM